METEVTLEQAQVAINELREEVKKAIPDAGKVKAMNETLDAYEVKSAEIVAKQQESEEKALALEEKVNGLEAALAYKSSGPVTAENYKESEEYKAINAFCKGDLVALDSEQKALLRTDIDPQGGYLVPRELDREIIKKITEISPIRQIARVRSLGGKSLDLPKRDTIPDASYEGETGTSKESNATYAAESMTPFRLTYTAPITMDMLMDSQFDMESEITSDAQEAFAQKEGNKFVLGTGSKQPFGFLADARVIANFITSATSAVLATEDMLKVTGELKSGYNPVWVLNRRTLATLRQEKSTTGQYIWQPGINGVVANSLAGFNYVIANDMPDIASDALAVAFGDFRRGYTIVDRTGMSIIRDELTRKKEAIVEFTMNRWNYGQVVLPEALTGIKIKT